MSWEKIHSSFVCILFNTKLDENSNEKNIDRIEAVDISKKNYLVCVADRLHWRFRTVWMWYVDWEDMVWAGITVVINRRIAIGQNLFDATISLNIAIQIQMGKEICTVIGGYTTWQLLFLLTTTANFQWTTDLQVFTEWLLFFSSVKFFH